MKKLHRNIYDSIIAGVCSGIADYLEIDKNVIRLIAIAGFFWAFPVFLTVYIAAWVLLPVKNY